jgi:serine/threonine/tyrosine-interacting protein
MARLEVPSSDPLRIFFLELMFPRFEYRRNMQQVLPNVFLGPLGVARVNSTLHSNKITLLIPVRTSATARFLQIPLDDNGQSWPAFTVDIQHDQIMGWFYRTYVRVKEEIERGGRVFIYCENGNGLSAAICVALVMDTRLYSPVYSLVNGRWDYRTAREFVQRKRYSIDIPDWARFSLEVFPF